MADEVNQAAFDGGDTSPATKDEIKAKNEAVQKYHDAQVAIAETKAQAHQDALDAAAEAEATVFEELGSIGQQSQVEGYSLQKPGEGPTEGGKSKAKAS